MEYKASEVFAWLLYEKGWEEFKTNAIKLHKVFYELHKKNPEIMKNFKFIKRTNPFSSTLQNLITLFQLVGALSRSNPNYLEYRINRDRLKQLLPEDTTGLGDFHNLEDLNQLKAA